MEAGAQVTLVSGPVGLETPQRVERVDVESAQQMHEAIMAHAPACDIYIGTAAVSDFSLVAPYEQKIKKGEDTRELQLLLRRTPDILASVAGLESPPFTVGFAAETEQVLAYAKDKLKRKGLDMIAANQVGPERGFDQEENALEVLWMDNQRSLPLAPKAKLARSLINLIAENYARKS
jgi:phosphopantothenoylcysteine decarboxylase/phosphopantothenate--cysteine ligase